MRILMSLLILVLISFPAVVAGQIVIPGAIGRDQSLTVSVIDTTIDLALADMGSVYGNPQNTPGTGFYDADEWVIVFRYTDVTISPGATLKFKNHPSGAPVVWLVSGDVTIGSTAIVDIRGTTASGAAGFSIPGPGGFRGGESRVGTSPSSTGLGPAGGNRDNNGRGAGHRTLGELNSLAPYGYHRIIPLMGGSGGGGDTGNNNAAGGAGGGALLIAAQGTITMDGIIKAVGSNGAGSVGGSGSGGAVKLVADHVGGTGAIDVSGGTTGYDGGHGRVRFESNTIEQSLVDNVSDGDGAGLSHVQVDNPVILWRDQIPASELLGAGSPVVEVISVDGVDVSAIDPNANFESPDASIHTLADSVDVIVRTTHVPFDWTVTLRVVPRAEASVNLVAGSPTTVIDATRADWVFRVPRFSDTAVFQARADAP